MTLSTPYRKAIKMFVPVTDSSLLHHYQNWNRILPFSRRSLQGKTPWLVRQLHPRVLLPLAGMRVLHVSAHFGRIDCFCSDSLEVNWSHNNVIRKRSPMILSQFVERWLWVFKDEKLIHHSNRLLFMHQSMKKWNTNICKSGLLSRRPISDSLIINHVNHVTRFYICAFCSFSNSFFDWVHRCLYTF